jgi:hypothetical protein
MLLALTHPLHLLAHRQPPPDGDGLNEKNVRAHNSRLWEQTHETVYVLVKGRFCLLSNTPAVSASSPPPPLGHAAVCIWLSSGWLPTPTPTWVSWGLQSGLPGRLSTPTPRLWGVWAATTLPATAPGLCSAALSAAARRLLWAVPGWMLRCALLLLPDGCGVLGLKGEVVLRRK